MREPRVYNLAPQDVAAFLKSDLETGLNPQEARQLLETYGPNVLKEKQAVSPFEIFIDQFKDFVIWVLIGAALISGFLKEWVDAIAIMAIVFLNAVIGFTQEYRAEKSLSALKKLSSPTTKVIRQKQYHMIATEELVPGDLVELEAGDHVPADGRVVLATANFRVQEASLTGESTPVLKVPEALSEPEVPLADRANMVYLGTSVSSGKARVLIVKTGMETELGKIAGMIQDIKAEPTPLQKKLEAYGKTIVVVCFVLVTIVFVLQWLHGGALIDAFLTSVSLAVAAVPEGLPAVVTIALALGVQRMVKRHALIRKLPSVETLGCATVICSDKTGTLTKNEMTVQTIFVNSHYIHVSGVGYEPKGEFTLKDQRMDPSQNPALKQALLCGLLCNGAQLINRDGYKILGDPTEGALLTAAAKAGFWKEAEEKTFDFVEEIPFDSQRKKMTVIRKNNGHTTAFVKGAPDVLLNDCSRYQDNDAVKPLNSEIKESIAQANDSLADQAMRVLAVAYRPLEGTVASHDPEAVEKDLIFAGLMAMIDPPREEVKLAMAECQDAGIKTVMITGDHKKTAVAIARTLGFYKDDSLSLTGEELDALSDEDFFKNIEKVPVYARVSPEHKLRIVRMWKRRGEIVAMTGDGVNDAPAVKEADIGVAMGITGTDVTKEVSDMIVMDDNFASIVAAVEEGRGIYENIQKFIHYLLSCNAGEVLLMFVAALVGWPAPLLPIHILWVNLVTDGFPALALGVDPVNPNIMKDPPRDPREPVITKERAWLMFLQGTFIAACSLTAFCIVYFVEQEGLDQARTEAFIVLSCSQLFHAFNCRSQVESIFKLGIFANPKLILATGVSFALTMAVVYVPFLQVIFKTHPLSLLDWMLAIGLSSFPLWAMEIAKVVRRKKINSGK